MPPEISDDELKAFKAAQAERDAWKAERDAAALKAKDDDKSKDEPDLVEKARRQREESDKGKTDVKRLTNAIAFNMKAGEFLKANEALLPPDVSDIITAAEKETYNDDTEKADAIKAGVVQSFFKVQEHYDLLTSGQKRELDDYLKLTKTGKQEKASAIYDMIFEPALERLKGERRASALNKGLAAGGGADEAYRNKMYQKSVKHYGIQENK